MVCVFIYARVIHFAMDGDGLFLHHFFLGWYKKHIVWLQRDVWGGAFHDAVYVNGNHFECPVGFHSVHDGMGGECFFANPLCVFNQRFHAADIASHLIHARAEYGSFDFRHV